MGDIVPEMYDPEILERYILFSEFIQELGTGLGQIFGRDIYVEWQRQDVYIRRGRPK